MAGCPPQLCCKQGVSTFVQCSWAMGAGLNLELILYLSCSGHKTRGCVLIGDTVSNVPASTSDPSCQTPKAKNDTSWESKQPPPSRTRRAGSFCCIYICVPLPVTPWKITCPAYVPERKGAASECDGCCKGPRVWGRGGLGLFSRQ